MLPSSLHKIDIGNSFWGPPSSYIYLLYSKKYNIIYVGQTCEQNGALGRLCGHLANNGTFRSKVYETGYNIDEISDLSLCVYRLPNVAYFSSAERTYREGVEFLVQKRLRDISGELSPYLKVVSWVKYNDSASLPEIKKVAKSVIEEFIGLYENDLS